MAPEILKGMKYNTKSDIWSIAVLIYELLFKKCPYEELTVTRLKKAIASKALEFPSDKQNISAETKMLLTRMLEPDPKKRIP